MPKATGKEIAKANKWEPCAPMGEGELRLPHINVDATSAQLSGLELGQEVVLTVKGKVESLQRDKHSSRIGLTVDLQEIYPAKEKNEFEKMAEDEE